MFGPVYGILQIAVRVRPFDGEARYDLLQANPHRRLRPPLEGHKQDEAALPLLGPLPSEDLRVHFSVSYHHSGSSVCKTEHLIMSLYKKSILACSKRFPHTSIGFFVLLYSFESADYFHNHRLHTIIWLFGVAQTPLDQPSGNIEL